MSSDGKNGMVAVYQLIGEDAGRLRRRRRRLPRLWRRITRRGERFDSQPDVFWTYTVPMPAPATPAEIHRMRERFRSAGNPDEAAAPHYSLDEQRERFTGDAVSDEGAAQ